MTAPADRTLCHSQEHTRLGVLAEVVVTFGELGVRWQRDALWQDAWGRSFAMCGECWDTTRQIAQGVRPGLVITEPARPVAGAGPLAVLVRRRLPACCPRPCRQAPTGPPNLDQRM